MSSSSDFKDKSYEQNYKVINLLCENKKLSNENKELKRMVQKLKSQSRVNTLIKESNGQIVILVSKKKETLLN